MSALLPNDVYIAIAHESGYGICNVPYPIELPVGLRVTTSLVALRNLFQRAGLDTGRYGTPGWNPLGDLVEPGSKVLVKPNWVLHRNTSGGGLDCLITHPTVIEALMHYLVKAHPGEIVIGDAPLQGCDWDALARACELESMIKSLSYANCPITLRDFRLTLLPSGNFYGSQNRSSRSYDDYILYDLGPESLLEPITSASSDFRVTMYNPDILKKRHYPGKHEYLLAREAIDADVVFNLPKLKTHMKSCLTGALKNMVGVNGHKEYLPHHRKGGSSQGGDCYPGNSGLKAIAEHLLDRINRAREVVPKAFLYSQVKLIRGVLTLLGRDAGLEGSWHGNDTVWRMCLDLQRIVSYGRPDGRLADRVQRKVITITDAIVAGEGNGPLAPRPVPLGILTMGLSPAALDWVHALVMGFDAFRIPLVRESFSSFRWPLAGCAPEDLMVRSSLGAFSPHDFAHRYGRFFEPPNGWKEWLASSKEQDQ